MLAEEMECFLVCVCVCGCVHMFGAAGVSDESKTLPQYFACVYICLNVWWHPAGIRPVPACSCQRRARNALPQHNCLNTSPSAVSPLSCQDEITSRGFIYLFHRAPDRHLTSALSRVSPPPHPTPPSLPYNEKSAWQTTLGTFKRRTRRKHKKGWKKTPTHSSLITSFFCLQEAPAIHLPILGPESLRVA